MASILPSFLCILHSKSAPVTGLPEGVYAVAATDGKKHAIMLTRFIDESEIGACTEELSLSFGLASDKKYNAYIQTVENNALTEKRPLAIEKEGSTKISLPMYSIAFIEIEEA